MGIPQWQALYGASRTVAKPLFRHGMFRPHELGNRFATGLLGAGAEAGVFAVPAPSDRLDEAAIVATGFTGRVMRVKSSSVGETFREYSDLIHDANGKLVVADYFAPVQLGAITRVVDGLLCNEFDQWGALLGEACSVVFRTTNGVGIDAEYFFLSPTALWAFEVEDRVDSYRRYSQEIQKGNVLYTDLRDAVWEFMTQDERTRVQ